MSYGQNPYGNPYGQQPGQPNPYGAPQSQPTGSPYQQPSWQQPGQGYGLPYGQPQPGQAQPGQPQPGQSQGQPGQPQPGHGFGQPAYGQPSYGQPQGQPAHGQPSAPAQPAQPGPHGQPGQPQQGQPQPWQQPGQPDSQQQPGQPDIGQRQGQLQDQAGQSDADDRPVPTTPVPEPTARRASFVDFDLPVVTTEFLPGFDATEVVGPVFGVAVRARGTRGAELAAQLVAARQEAVTNLVEMAKEIGAEAVVSLAFDSGAPAGDDVEILAYGTAVLIQADDDPELTEEEFDAMLGSPQEADDTAAQPEAAADEILSGPADDEARHAFGDQTDGDTDQQADDAGPTFDDEADDTTHLVPRPTLDELRAAQAGQASEEQPHVPTAETNEEPTF